MSSRLCLVSLLLLACAAASAAPRLFYSKSFPGSAPPYMEIQLEQDGSAVYKDAPDDEQPLQFKLSEADTAAIFQLAEKLEKFTRPIESGLKVANMGMKTFRWEDGASKSEQKFNYSQDLDAQALLDWFEKIAESEQYLGRLDRAVHFDKLGVNQVLLQLELAYDKKRLLAVDQFVPMLERVAKNESFLNMARERAAYLADAFRGKVKTE
jgi:hypothetical protein